MSSSSRRTNTAGGAGAPTQVGGDHIGRGISASRFRTVAAAAAGLALALVLVGCGGGGGRGAAQTYVGRTYSFASGARVLSISIDLAGRFTVFARDPALLAQPIAAQGTIAQNGTFFAQSVDGQSQFEGVVASGASSVSCTVKSGGATLFVADAPLVETSASTTQALIGTYASTSPAPPVHLTVDSRGSSTLWIQDGATVGGDLLTVAGDGSLASADGTFAGRLDVSSADPLLTITKLNGMSVQLAVNLGQSARPKWTFMVFINGANDLQPYGALNVNQMEKVGSTADVNIVVQWKQANCSSCGAPPWVSTRRYYVTRDADTGKIGSQLVEDMGPNVDMGDWRQLYAFISWAQQHYPAERYALVIWDHGAGWRNTRAGQTAALRSVSIDDSTGSEIQTWQLPQALNVTPKLDLLIFDASLMQMAEVAYEVRNSAAIMVGSEESPPGEGYVYDPFLSDLAADPMMEPAAFAGRIVTRTIESYGQNSNITQSAVDLSRMQSVAVALDGFARSLSFHAPTYGATLVAARRNAESYAYRDNKDLWHYAELVRNGGVPAPLQSAAADVQQAVSDAVIVERHGDLHPNSHGLAVYVPDPASYLLTYSNLALTRVTQWDEWLRGQPAG